MDVHKLIKMNELASELRKHNFAISSEEAFKQAEGVLDSTGMSQPQVQAQKLEFPQAPTQQQPPHSELVEKPKVAQQDDGLALRKVELMLEMNNKKVAQEITLLRSTINQLMSELDSMKKELGRLSEVNPKPKEKQVPLETQDKVEHPRQGDYAPGDVDIQKMFYFGNK